MGLWNQIFASAAAVDRVRLEERRRGLAFTTEVLGTLDDDALGPYESIRQRQRAEQLRDALRALPAAQRDVLLLCYFGGLTQREVAAAQTPRSERSRHARSPPCAGSARTWRSTSPDGPAPGVVRALRPADR